MAKIYFFIKECDHSYSYYIKYLLKDKTQTTIIMKCKHRKAIMLDNLAHMHIEQGRVGAGKEGEEERASRES